MSDRPETGKLQEIKLTHATGCLTTEEEAWLIARVEELETQVAVLKRGDSWRLFTPEQLEKVQKRLSELGL